MLLTFAADAGVTASLADDRALSGLALPFGIPGRTSAGLLTVPPGTVRVPPELRRVKLFTEHGRGTPIGYATAAAADDTGLRMVFRVAHTPAGDDALLEASEGVRDALSVELDAAVVKNGRLVSADLVGVAGHIGAGVRRRPPGRDPGPRHRPRPRPRTRPAGAAGPRTGGTRRARNPAPRDRVRPGAADLPTGRRGNRRGR